MHNELAWRQQCWKSCANGSNIVALRFGDHGTKEMLGVVGWKVWPVSNFAQQHATTSNNMQRGVQTDATCNIQQYWELLVNNVLQAAWHFKIVLPTGFLQLHFDDLMPRALKCRHILKVSKSNGYSVSVLHCLFNSLIMLLFVIFYCINLLVLD